LMEGDAAARLAGKKVTILFPETLTFHKLFL